LFFSLTAPKSLLHTPPTANPAPNNYQTTHPNVANVLGELAILQTLSNQENRLETNETTGESQLQ